MQQRENMRILVMGVSGSGKTTIAEALSHRLGFPMIEADDYHSEESLAKMKSGIPLDDDDRLPWLLSLKDTIHHYKSCVIACSALKKKYRELLKEGSSHFVTVFLKGDFDTIYHRMVSRDDHFMPPDLLRSQYETLEPPLNAIIIDVEDTIENQLSKVIKEIKNLELNQMELADIGLIGLGVMGKALARNLASKDYKVAVYNVPFPGEEEVVQKFTQFFSELDFIPCEDLQHLAESLQQPRKIILMIKAGSPVDQMIDQLIPVLDPGDMIVDGGNSFYRDTESRTVRCKEERIHFIGMGVSGGESGALNGPSIMPSGDMGCKEELLPILESIAAIADGYPCVKWIGTGGSGHFVKMIHNGIEYADMQLLSEAYDILKNGEGIKNEGIATIFSGWKDSMHNSYLLEITINILRKKVNGTYVLDEILDVAGHKGTGLWTSREALELGVPVPTIQSAMNQRIISSFKTLRESVGSHVKVGDFRIDDGVLQKGILFCRLMALMEGLHMIITADRKYKWGITMNDVLSIWRGGCIIRSDMLLSFKFIDFNKVENHPLNSWEVDDLLSELYPFAHILQLKLAELHLSFPAIHAAIDHYRSLKRVKLPVNMIQAQRDYFGAHTYRRLDDRDQAHHTQWE